MHVETLNHHVFKDFLNSVAGGKTLGLSSEKSSTENIGQDININLITSFLFTNIPHNKSDHLLTHTPPAHFTLPVLISDHRM